MLIAQDQLTVERMIKRTAHKYLEGEINFAPTFKYIRETTLYNTKRNPSWTDRILYRCNQRLLEQVNYESNNLIQISDHRPVFG